MAHITHHHEPARHWQDWVNMILGALMVASPWLFGYAPLEGATMNAVIIGFLVFALSALSLTLLDDWEAYISAGLGVWLILSPWLLGFALYDPARLAHLAIGILVVAVAVLEVWQSRPRS
ncbi:SPW repeat protein [Ferrovibrio sp.]|uniref:SPW repeat protein n=1 Tax=Ferrovibrio sp. TaxID=1917215 RepID=UPI00311EEB46